MYEQEYADKLTSPQDAATLVQSGRTIVHGMGTAEPSALLEAISDRVHSGAIGDLKVFSLLPMDTACRTILAEELADRVHAYTWFTSKGDRELVHIGLDQFIPCNFHEVPRLCREYMDIDVCVTTVSPMDKSGFFSFGTVNDYTSVAAGSILSEEPIIHAGASRSLRSARLQKTARFQKLFLAWSPEPS